MDGQGEWAGTRVSAADRRRQVVAMRMYASKHGKAGDSQPVTPADVDPIEARLDSLANTLSLVSSEQVCLCSVFVLSFPVSLPDFPPPPGAL